MKIADLRAAVEGMLGRPVAVFRKIATCARTDNHYVETADGGCFVAKCVPVGSEAHGYVLEHLVPHLRALEGLDVAERLVCGPRVVGGLCVVLLSFCAGGPVRPDRLSPAREADLVRAYLKFSAAIQGAGPTLPAQDGGALRGMALARLDAPALREVRDFVLREIDLAAISYDPRRLRVIHGDLHSKNFHFDGDRVSGFFDLESFRLGYPAEDWIHYLIAGAEHSGMFGGIARRRRMAFLGRRLPLYPADEWRLAVDRMILKRVISGIGEGAGALAAWRAKRRFRFYLDLHRIFRATCPPPTAPEA